MYSFSMRTLPSRTTKIARCSLPSAMIVAPAAYVRRSAAAKRRLRSSSVR
jgi:hypothetical protein